MPFQSNAARRHYIPKQRGKVTNRGEYDASLRQHGSLTDWFTDGAIAAWQATPLGPVCRRGPTRPVRGHNSLSPSCSARALSCICCGGPLFFNLRRPNWALIEVPFLWLSAVALMVALASFAPMASWLLLPAPGGLRCRSQSHHRPDEPAAWGYRLAIGSERRSGAFPCGEDTLARLPTSG